MSRPAASLGRLEVHLGRLLVTGVLTSAVLLLAGLSLWFANPQSAAALAFLNGGLVVLMATPIMRVVVSFVEYVMMRDWFFAGITVLVLIELSVTVLVALSRR